MIKLIRFICFWSLAALILTFLGEVVKPKRGVEVAIDNYHDEHVGMYELPKNTIDVLYLGSSHAFSSISPEDIWNEYGITGYVQASSRQKIWQSYFYLEEAFYTQHPKVVVLDVYTALEETAQDEPFNREAIDKMCWSKAKEHAIKKAVEKNPEVEDSLSYYFPVLRYHDRWSTLGESDFQYFVTESDSKTKGFLPRLSVKGGTFNKWDYNPDKVQDKKMGPESEEYLGKIKALCDQNDVPLILVKFPTAKWTLANSQCVEKWAQKNVVTFLDYNATESLRDGVGIDWEHDMLDGNNHVNYYGALKVSKTIGKYLQTNFKITDKREDEAYQKWDRDYDYYKRCVDDSILRKTKDFQEYCAQIKDKAYVVFLINTALQKQDSEEVIQKLEELGVSRSLWEDSYGKANLFLLNGGIGLKEECSTEPISMRYRQGNKVWNAFDKFESSNVPSVFQDNKEYATTDQGIQFVVFDPVTEKHVETSVWATDEDGEIKRK